MMQSTSAGPAQASLARRTGRLFINYLRKVGQTGVGAYSPRVAVEIDGNAYSMPWRLIGEMVRATVADGMVRIHYGLHEVAVHPICAGRRRRVIDPAHFEGLTGFRASHAGGLALSPISPPAPRSASTRRSWEGAFDASRRSRSRYADPIRADRYP
jgi:hypothetical protein